MTRVCNDTGRAFEYCTAEKLSAFLSSKKIPYSFTSRSQEDNKRDKAYFECLSNDLKQDFSKAGDAAIKWIDAQKWLDNAKKVVIVRMSDQEGVKRSVIDIQLQIYNDKGLLIRNISLKHHHNALKHPRLPSLPFQCGITDPKITKQWRETHDKVWAQFYAEAKKLDNAATKFRDLKAKQHDFIDKNLYKPLISAVIVFLEKYANNPKNAARFFEFLRGGNFSFFTIKNEPEQILVKKFAEYKSPSSFSTEYPYGTLTTFLLAFDNKWRITLRLHTASEEFFRNGKLQMSTKFDVLCENLEEVVSIDKVLK